MNHVTPSYILWWEPRWSFVAFVIRAFRTALGLGAWFRIIAISAIVAVTIAMLTNALVPALKFNWVAAFGGSIAATVVFFVIALLLLAAIPPLVFITHHGFGWWWPPILHQGFTYFKRSDLKSVTLTIRDDGMHYLRFRTNRFCKRIGVAPRVDLNHLLELCGDLLVVRDRRRHRSTERSSRASIRMDAYANEQNDARERPSSSDLNGKSITAAP